MKRMLKRFSSIVMAALLLFCLMPAANAASADLIQQSYFVEDLGNGFTKETTITVEPALTRSSIQTDRVTKSEVYKQDGVRIATVNFTVYFSYDGNRSWVDDTSYSKSLTSGWSYTNHNVTTFGGSARLTATLKKSPFSVPVDISLRCSPSGDIS